MKRIEEKLWREWLQKQLRRVSYKWGERTKAKSRARLERGIYRCNSCHEEFRAKDIQLDHKLPVIDPSTGFVDWNQYIDRLFCDVDGYQVLCKPCHTQKTVAENAGRTRKKS